MIFRNISYKFYWCVKCALLSEPAKQTIPCDGSTLVPPFIDFNLPHRICIIALLIHHFPDPSGFFIAPGRALQTSHNREKHAVAGVNTINKTLTI